MDRHEFSDTLGSSGAGIRRGLHRADITAHHHGHVPTADILTADQGDVGGLSAGIALEPNTGTLTGDWRTNV